jgi:hypothetical protein
VLIRQVLDHATQVKLYDAMKILDVIWNFLPFEYALDRKTVGSLVTYHEEKKITRQYRAKFSQ